MLNRRLLRIKVMQELYALKQSEISSFHNAIAYIEGFYAPDLNSMEVQDTVKLGESKKKASAFFEQNYKSSNFTATDENSDVIAVVSKAIDHYKADIRKDRRHFQNLLQEDIEEIKDEYLSVLLLILRLAEYGLEHDEEKKARHIKSTDDFISGKNFAENKMVEMLKENGELETGRIKRNLSWPTEFVRKFYKEVLLKDKAFEDYLKESKIDFEKDKKIVLYIAKSLIFKEKMSQEFFEEKDLYWGENKSIVNGLVSKSLKEPSSPSDGVKILELSPNWDDDRSFFTELFEKTLSIEDELEDIVSAKAENWDTERIAAIDMIILKMALTEMLHFSSIPVKVTINEYIELSKEYSTPKSKKFINGMLDNLSAELISKGQIRKSGRGLIDNK